jgi:hypothetical protein
MREGDNLREQLEIQYNTPQGGSANTPGDLSNFANLDYVRLLQLGGKDARIDYLGVRSWSYEGSAYKVELDYEVETPLAKFPLLVVLVGVESPTREFKGRQYQVLLRETRRADNDSRLIEWTEKGQEHQRLGEKAEEFADLWTRDVVMGELRSAYLKTLPPEQRPAAEDRGMTFSRGYLRFLGGDVVNDSKPTFWADPTQSDEIVRGVRRLFGRGVKPSFVLTPQSLVRRNGAVALCERSDTEVVVRCDVQIMVTEEPPGPPRPRYVVEGRLVVVCDAKSADEGRPDWRIRELELLRGRTAPQQGGSGPRLPRPMGQ